MLTERDYQEAARKLGCEIPVIKAVVEVESSGSGFLTTGEIKILFEPHIWWRELIKEGKDPKKILAENPDLRNVLYEKWGTEPYGRPSEQWNRLRQAAQIDIDSAHRSASYGMFQIMGFHHKLIGYEDIFEMIHFFGLSESYHLDGFVKFVQSQKIDRFLVQKNWSAFAKGYNGKSYKKNKYDIKLWEAYKKYKQNPLPLVVKIGDK